MMQLMLTSSRRYLFLIVRRETARDTMQITKTNPSNIASAMVEAEKSEKLVSLQ